MPKRKDGTPSGAGKANPERSRRFVEMARQLGCEENLDRFDKAVKRIGRARRPPQAARKAQKENKGRLSS